MNSDRLPSVAAEARVTLAKLGQLWDDEGVQQLEIFLDPDIVSVLAEIKSISLEFITRVAALDEQG